MIGGERKEKKKKKGRNQEGEDGGLPGGAGKYTTGKVAGVVPSLWTLPQWAVVNYTGHPGLVRPGIIPEYRSDSHGRICQLYR